MVAVFTDTINKRPSSKKLTEAIISALFVQSHEGTILVSNELTSKTCLSSNHLSILGNISGMGTLSETLSLEPVYSRKHRETGALLETCMIWYSLLFVVYFTDGYLSVTGEVFPCLSLLTVSRTCCHTGVDPYINVMFS